MKKEKYLQKLNTVFQYIKPHKRKLIALVFLSSLSALGNSFTPYIGGKLFDAILGNIHSVRLFSFSFNPFVFILTFWILARLVDDISDRFKEVKREELATVIEGEYIINGYSKLIHFPLAFHKKHKMGETINRIQKGAGSMEGIINRVLIELAPDFLSIIIALFIIFTIQPILAFILLTSILIYIAVLIKIAPKIANISRKMHQYYSRAYGDSYDTVLNVQAVKQATAEEYEKKKLFRNFLLRAARFYVDFIKLQSGLNLIQRLLITFSHFALFIGGIYMIRKNQLTAGELIAFTGYAGMLFSPFIVLGRNWNIIQNGLVAIERAEEILKKPEEKYVPENAVILTDIKGEVEFKNVSFRYSKNQKYILDDISFKVKPGMSIALVGESGMGKTTLIDLISFYFRPASGKIYIDNHNLASLDLKTLRSFIAVVPQEILLFNDTVKNNIKYGKFNASDEEVVEAVRLAHADEFIENFSKKYEQLVGERGIKLSVGQKQRIAIARAILRNPKILILDEPTSALDAKSEKFISESLEKLMENRTTFIIAHRLSTVRKADVILVLDKGKIVESGRHEELIKIPNGIYRRLYEFQIGLK
ncbi:MAG: ABC transporter ATP-binding protein [Parcubacteria group bacterium]|nr:ABC transporter ATP-binding protein [Parcubacteria group bacterium]